MIKMIVKYRSPHMRHDSRTGSLKESVWIRTCQQMADIFIAKGSFTRDKWDELMILFGIVSESYHSSHLSVVATLVLLVHQMAKRSHPSADEASKFPGASSKSKPVGKRILALAAGRHDESRPVQESIS